MASTPEDSSSREQNSQKYALPSGLSEADLLPEAAQAAREPYSVKCWLAYVAAVRASKLSSCDLIGVYECAVAALPGSYKLWRQYADCARKYGALFHPSHPSRAHAVSVSQRAAKALRAAPRLWEDLLELCVEECLLQDARKALDSALQALPVSQHDRIWSLVLRKLVPVAGMISKQALIARYADLRPRLGAVRLFELRKAASLWDDAVTGLVGCLDQNEWDPDGEKSREALWTEAAEIAVKHPHDVVSIDVPAFLREGLSRANDAKGLRRADLYQLLARYFIRCGKFEEARGVFEESVHVVDTVRDFAVLYDAYAKFEESLVSAALEDVEDIREDEEPDKEELKDAEAVLEVLMTRLENLTDRRPILLSDVWIKQNPHNVLEWHKRARLLKKMGNPAAVVQTYTQAIQTVDPMRASSGRSYTLWLAFASYYEEADDKISARKVLEKAVSDPEKFASAQDYAAVWCEYAETELRWEDPRKALQVLVRATVQPDEGRKRELMKDHGVGSHAKKNGVIDYDYNDKGRALSAWKSNKLWSFLLDLTESLEPPNEVIALYDRLLDANIATSENILNGAKYLQSKRLFEQAFRLYDRGVSSLQWPEALNVWVVYLSSFMKRYGKKKVERVRNLFEEAVKAAPSERKFGRNIPNKNLPLLFRMWADFEERVSLPRRSMMVLSRGARSVSPAQRAAMYRLYIVRMGALFGVTRTRAIFVEALTELHKLEDVLEFARRFAAAETQLGEVDRARAIFLHAAKVTNSRAGAGTPSGDYWKAWHDFELAHGSEDSFRTMLRVKRSVLISNPTIAMTNALTNNVESGDMDDRVGAIEPSNDVNKEISGRDGSVVANNGVSGDAENTEDHQKAGAGSGDSGGEDSEEMEDGIPQNVDDEIQVTSISAGSNSTGADSGKAKLRSTELESSAISPANACAVGTKRKEHALPSGDVERNAGVKESLGALERFKRKRM